MYKLALSDNHFSFTERITLYTIAKEYGIEEEDFDRIINSPTTEEFIPDNLEEKIAQLYDLTRIALADDIIEDIERKLLREFIIRYGFLEENADAIIDFFISEVKNNTTTNEVIRKLKEEE